ncbi:hypothetical protein LZC95_50315 [Pendulispora brunnea]|uniref:Uncharacterized protein n=1 Tax=Pendulispora brunnea TaxID=2905690 RepID=A0ABZ2K7E7_9BACT
MDYTIRIGEAAVLYDDPGRSPRPGVVTIQRDGAPQFIADGGNELRVPRPVWEGFCKRTGLSGLFFDKCDGLMRSGANAGCVPLDLTALSCIENCVESWCRRHPNAVPDLAAEDGAESNRDLALLLWLQYWFEYALDHCERPIVAHE